MIDLLSRDHQLVLYELAVAGVYHLDALPFDPEEIVDCGGHIGLFSRLAKARFATAKLTCFEPSPMNLQWLRRQFNPGVGHVTVIEAAVGSADGMGVLHGEGCGSTLEDAGSGGAQVSVPIINLRNWLEANLSGSRLLLKLDIEGKEFDVLPHILPVLPDETIILFETHSFAGQAETLFDTLRDNGFSVTIERSRTDGSHVYHDARATRIQPAA